MGRVFQNAPQLGTINISEKALDQLFSLLIKRKLSHRCQDRLYQDTCVWIVGHSLSLASAEKDSADNFDGCKTETDSFIGYFIDALVRQVMIFLMVKDKLKIIF